MNNHSSVSFLASLVAISVFSGAIWAQAPTVDVVVRPDKPLQNVPFLVDYEVTWDGVAEQYSVLGAEIEDFEWGSAKALAITGSAAGKSMKIIQTVEYTSLQVGDMDLPPVKIAYFDPTMAQNVDTNADPAEEPAPVDNPRLTAPSTAIYVSPDRRAMTISGVIGVVLVVCTLTFMALYKLRRGPAVASASPESTFSSVQSEMHLAKQKRLDGDYYEYLVSLSRATAFLGSDSEASALHNRLKKQADDVGFKNLRPTDDEMDGALRDVERLSDRLNREKT